MAEITAYYSEQTNIRLINKDVLLLSTDQELNIEDDIKNLGGTIKSGVVFDSTINTKTEFIVNKVKNILKPGKQKFKFGVSYYGDKKINLKPVGMEIKKILKEQSVSCRWVTSKETALSSVVVEQNKLIGNGIEISIIEDSGKYLLGRTLAVQPFKSLSFRDFGRPSRDDSSGMLPPKLAQIMINLSGAMKDDIILDPFCGSGTIITEAMLMGYTKIYGSDISAKAIKDTQDNIRWIKEKFLSTKTKPTIKESSAVDVSQFMEPHTVSAIICEPFLGQQKGGFDIKKQTIELEKLYSDSLSEFRKVLKPGGTIVMLFPVFFNKHKINPNLDGYEIVNPVPLKLIKNNIIKLTARRTIVYGRQGQRVFREIVVLKKQ